MTKTNIRHMLRKFGDAILDLRDGTELPVSMSWRDSKVLKENARRSYLRRDHSKVLVYSYNDQKLIGIDPSAVLSITPLSTILNNGK